MREKPQAVWLSEGHRMRFWHGPIDLVIEACGTPEEVQMAFQQAWTSFVPLLDELASELPLLRTSITCSHPPEAIGETANAMCVAATRLADIDSVTPMIAVAGAVADHVLEHMTCGRTLSRAAVNNGGDVALHLSAPRSDAPISDHSWTIGIATLSSNPIQCSDECSEPLAGHLVIDHASPIRGVATSGWRGRSHSLGIADAVTVLARDAAGADVAATLLANAIDVPGHPAIERAPANSLYADSDLGDRQVTIAVGYLPKDAIRDALQRARQLGQHLIARGDMVAAHAILQDEHLTLGQALANSRHTIQDDSEIASHA